MHWSVVEVEGVRVSSTGRGMLVFIGIADSDELNDTRYLAKKTASLRIFEDSQGKMNLSIREVGGEVLVVSQFTLVAETGKGNRPSFGPAAPPDRAKRLYGQFVQEMENLGIKVKTGVFGADMAVSLCNDGPVTMLLESKLR